MGLAPLPALESCKSGRRPSDTVRMTSRVSTAYANTTFRIASHFPLRSERPGMASVCVPRSNTTPPFTTTNSIPSL